MARMADQTGLEALRALAKERNISEDEALVLAVGCMRWMLLQTDHDVAIWTKRPDAERPENNEFPGLVKLRKG